MSVLHNSMQENDLSKTVIRPISFAVETAVYCFPGTGYNLKMSDLDLPPDICCYQVTLSKYHRPTFAVSQIFHVDCRNIW